MKCPECQFENREGVKFCEKCGVKIELICPNCGAKIPLDRLFCGECGHTLTESKEPPPIDYSEPQSYTPKFLAEKILTTRSSIEGERKLVTVFFADVANYTSISEKLDPEEVHQIMDGAFKILMDEIHKYEGTINQFTGDGVMALFGAPVAHEDHAQRACYTALSVQQAIGEYGKKIKEETGVDFAMRIGLNSGPVIVGSIGDNLRMDYTAVGDTTNLAARIQQSANPGQVWVSEETHNIIQNYFQDESVGEIPLKGKAQPQPIYRVLSERVEAHTRFEAGLVRGITELVGRRPEMETLRSAFENVKEGDAQLVDVVGEAGVGKSRLVYEFQKSLGTEVTFLTGFCVHYGRNINFLPLIDIVKTAFEINEGMTEKEVGNRIEEKSKEELTPMIPFYRNLLSLNIGDPQFNSLDPEGRKFGTFEAVKNLLLALSKEKPLVVFLEDVHWIDKISEEFFTFFSRCILGHSILMLSAYRPEGAPSWAQGAHYKRLGLETLSSKSSIRLVRNILGGIALEPELEQRIVDKTEGNPFFVEEIVRELLYRGDIIRSGDQYLSNRPINQLDIPNTVQGVLAARMDRLSEDLKGTMQVASVIGRDFAFRLLKTIMELGEELRTRLTNLVGLEIIYEKALYPELEYIFKHALTQEVAYESLLKQKRQDIHGRIAQAIEEIYSDRLEEHYEVLAYHYGRSEKAQESLKYLMLAGEKSNKNNAFHAASEFFQTTFEVMEKHGIELEPETMVQLYRGMARVNVNIGSVIKGSEELRKAIELCRQYQMVDTELKCLRQLAAISTILPLRAEAEQILKEGLARSREVEDKALESMFLSQMGQFYALYGEPYTGNQLTLEAERVGVESGNPLPIMAARGTQAATERWLGRPGKYIELTEGWVESLRDRLSLANLTNIIFMRGVALAEIGRIEDAMALLMEGIDLSEKFEVPLRLSTFYNCLGYCYSEIHHPETAGKLNLQAEATARELMEKYPMSRRLYAEQLAQDKVNIMENLFDQGKMDEAWNLIQSFKEESKSEYFDMLRHQWESRMNYLATRILLRRNDLGSAEKLIRENLKTAKVLHTKKREGGFLRLLGRLQVQLGDYDAATISLNEAISILKVVGNPRQLWEAHASLASAFSKLGRPSEEREQWGASAEVIQKVANGLSDRQLRAGFLGADPIREILSKTEN